MANIWQRNRGYNKYGNTKFEWRGEKFDSQAEWQYYMILADRQRKGEIKDLQRQVVFELQPTFKSESGKTIRAIKYIADFVYYETGTGKRHIVDVKGSKIMETDVFKLKAKIMAYQGNEIEEVFI